MNARGNFGKAAVVQTFVSETATGVDVLYKSEKFVSLARCGKSYFPDNSR
jgi:hypothetical protein